MQPNLHYYLLNRFLPKYW